MPAGLVVMIVRNIQFNFAEISTYIYLFREVLTFEQNCGNICWVFTAATGVDGEATYKNTIVTCKFMKALETVRPVDIVNGAYIHRFEGSVSTSFQLNIRFPIKVWG